jgi:putative tricarboxylic transport membrane protein
MSGVDGSAGEGDGQGGAAVGNRWPEIGLALFLMTLGVIVVIDSMRVGIGWGDDGPRSGYFPFYIGCLLIGSSGWIIVRQLLNWSRDRSVFAERAQLWLVFAIFWPMLVYVALVVAIGIYISSFALITYFMLRHGRYKLPLTLAVSVGVPLFFFLVFERWFLVQLPKGPVEAMLGL